MAFVLKQTPELNTVRSFILYNYEEIYDFNNLYKAYLKAKKGKA